MPARRVTTLTVPVDGRSAVAFESYPARTPLLTILATRPALLVTLTLPEHLDAGHVRFARDLAAIGRPVRHRSRAVLARPAVPARSAGIAHERAAPAGDPTTSRGPRHLRDHPEGHLRDD